MTTDLKYERVNYSVVDTGKAIRRALREAFPGVKFSLRGSRGTGYGWFSLSWVDGPTAAQVDAITNGFRSSYFDGMTDSTIQIPATMYADPDGVIREHDYSCHGVNSSRDFSDAAEAWAGALVDAYPNGVELFAADYNSRDVAIRRILSGVDMTRLDWSTVPPPARGFSGRHVPSSYCLETRVDTWHDDYAPKHAADVAS